MKRKELSKKERLFCDFYSRTRNTREAAFKAGYILAPERGGKINVPKVGEVING